MIPILINIYVDIVIILQIFLVVKGKSRGNHKPTYRLEAIPSNLEKSQSRMIGYLIDTIVMFSVNRVLKCSWW
jgi:hypothetical protein